MSEIEVIVAIKLGTNYSTNAYMIKHVEPDDRKMLNVPFKTQTTSQMSVTTPTVALFEDNGTISITSYGSEAELQYIHLADRRSHLLFREFIWHLFCADDTVGSFFKIKMNTMVIRFKCFFYIWSENIFLDSRKP